MLGVFSIEKKFDFLVKISTKSVDNYTLIEYNNTRKAGKQSPKKGSEEMEEMRATEILRLIEWLKAQGFNDTQIVECIEYISK